MKPLVFLLIVNLIVFAQEDIPSTVDTVDLDRYQGTWYEISKIPNSFQDHCMKGTTANYRINEDGEIIVTNSCIDDENERDEAEGLAKVIDRSGNSKLEVSFVSIFGWHLFWGDYWILGLDQEYKYAVIGTPSRKYGWILSRTPQMSKDDLEICFRILEQNGYKRETFVNTVH